MFNTNQKVCKLFAANDLSENGFRADTHFVAKKKDGINVPLYKDVNEAVNQLVDDSTGSKAKVVNRVLDWFVKQDEATRALVLGHIPADYVALVTAEMLKRMGNVETRDAKVDDELSGVGDPKAINRPSRPASKAAGSAAPRK